MKTESKGSAVLLILILMGTLTVLLLALVQENTILRIFVTRQMAAEQKNSLGQGLIAYGIALAKKNYDLLIESQHAEIEIPLNGYLGKVTVTGAQHGVSIESELLHAQEVVFKTSCTLTRTADKNFTIQGFQR